MLELLASTKMRFGGLDHAQCTTVRDAIFYALRWFSGETVVTLIKELTGERTGTAYVTATSPTS